MILSMKSCIFIKETNYFSILMKQPMHDIFYTMYNIGAEY